MSGHSALVVSIFFVWASTTGVRGSFLAASASLFGRFVRKEFIMVIVWIDGIGEAVMYGIE